MSHAAPARPPVHPRRSGLGGARRGAVCALDALRRQAATDHHVIGMGGGLPSPAQFPKRALADSFLRVIARRGGAALQYGWPEGISSLREKIAARLSRRGAEVFGEDIIVTSGAQQAIAIAFEVACRHGERVAVDPETYPAALELLRERGLVPVDMCEEMSAAYVMPAIGNPRGRPLARQLRARLLGARCAIIEDDAYADLCFAHPAPRPLLADLRQRVFHVGTFSKTLCPGLRIGYLIPPPRHFRAALRLKQSSDLQAGSLAQMIIDDYLRENDFDARLVRLRSSYHSRANLLAQALRHYLPSWQFSFPEGGFAFWLEPDSYVDERLFLERAIAAGVSFDVGSSFRRRNGSHPLAIRLCFSFVPPAALEEGTRRLAHAWSEVRRENGRAVG